MKYTFRLSAAVLSVVWIAAGASSLPAQTETKWKAHDRNRPAPTAVDPGAPGTENSTGRAPADAIVLFDGKDLSKWAHKDGGDAKWKVADGYFEVVPKTHDIFTRQAFGDMQLHVEFAEPSPPVGEDQDRGNSGIIIMGLVRNSGTGFLPEQNVSRWAGRRGLRTISAAGERVAPAGQWQTYDIVFHAPRFDDAENCCVPRM